MSVHIKISDRDWILETMAKNISSRLSYVSYDTEASSSAKIQYYLTYSTFRGRISDIEMAYFTHLEEDPATAKRFFDAAAAMDCCVSMSQLYARRLEESGIRNVEIIPPGVDVSKFDVGLRIGVVGRTYSTGRKGEALVAELMDLPGIDWFFTGDGWPGPALNLPETELPDFYRSLDYVLVPARYEGGPMSAIEAIACGVEVIAPPVGWMEELPHIPYRLNDAQDLRRVLGELLQKKRDLRTAVLDRTWDAFAERHDMLFRKLVPDPVELVRPGRSKPRQAKVLLVTHGMEQIAKGGPTTRIPQLCQGLRAKGYTASLGNFGATNLKDADLYHLFNVATPGTASAAMAGLKSFGKPVVFSPIYLDNRCRHLWSKILPDIFSGPGPVEARLADLQRLNYEAGQIRKLGAEEAGTLPASYHQKIAGLLQDATGLIFLSQLEQRQLSAATGLDLGGSVVRNPVDARTFREGDAQSFSQLCGVKDYVLCVGRIEPRKNQLLLAAALSGTGIPLVLIGETFEQAYADKIRAIPDLTVIFAGRIAAGSELLSSALAGARVFSLPSWSEGAPISALEAGAAGCKMVLSSFSGESEYFPERARFVDPSDFPGLKAALLQAYDQTWTKSDRSDLAEFTAQAYSIEKHAAQTAEVYDALLSQSPALAGPRPRKDARSAGPAPETVYFDVTTILNNPGRVTGITRVELSLTREVRAADKVVFIAWHDRLNAFFKVPERYLAFDEGPNYRDDPLITPFSSIERGAPLLVQGNAWLGNFAYVCALEGFVRANGLRLNLHVHDILPISHKQLFDAQQGERLLTHLNRLTKVVSIFSVDSLATKQDLDDHVEKRQNIAAETRVIRLGDDIDAGVVPGKDPEVSSPVAALIASGNYVLSVGSQSPHKNRELLIRLWERLVEDKGASAPALVIVGKADPQSPRHPISPKAQRHIHFLTSVTDIELIELYRNCLFTAFPSLCEGWGLPVAESLSHGKICIACDASSMKEIAPLATDLIDPLDAMAWYKRVKMYAFSPQARQRREREIAQLFVPQPWRETLDRMLETARSAPPAVIRHQPWDLETPFDFANYDHAGQLGLKRLPAGPQGGGAAELSLSLPGVAGDQITLDLLCASIGQGLVEVLVDDTLVGRLKFFQEPESVQSVLLSIPDTADGIRLTFRETGPVGFVPYKFILRRPEARSVAAHDSLGVQPLTLGPDRDHSISASNPAARRLAAFGWHAPEPSGIWSTAEAYLRLAPSIPLRGDLKLDLRFNVISAGWVVFRIGVDFVDAIHVSDTAVTKHTVIVPEGLLAGLGSYVDLKITHMSARSPEALGMSADKRVLGISLRTISYSVLPRKSEGVISGMFTRELLVRGWHPREASHVWSAGVGYIRFPTAEYAGKRMAFTLSSLIDIEVLAFMQGEYVVSQMVSKAHPARIVLDFPAVSETAFITVALLPSGTVVPSAIGYNADSRSLGFALHAIEVVRPEGLQTLTQARIKRGKSKLTRIGSRLIDATIRDRKNT